MFDYYKQVQVAALYDDAAEQLERLGVEYEAHDIMELCLIQLDCYDPSFPDDWSYAITEFAERHALILE